MQFLKSFDSEKIGYQIINQPQNSNNNIVVIPGFGGDINFLNRFLDELKTLNPRANLYFFSPRGHAFSSNNFPEGFDLENVYAQDFLAFIKYLNLKKFSVIGHSFGGFVIQNYLNLPNSIQPAQFFLICSAPRIGGIPFLKKTFYNLLARRSGDRKPFAYQTPRFYEKFEKSWDIDLMRWFHDTVVMGGIINWILHFLSLSPWHNHNLTTLNQETGYYLYGEKDIIITKSQQLNLLKKLPKINGLEINSGHLAPITNPEETAQLISLHINKL